MVRLAQWASSENYDRWGQPGDQRMDPMKGKTDSTFDGEVDIVDWQPNKWERVFRLIDVTKAELLANKAEASARNPHNGYAWDDATTKTSFYNALKAAGWDPAAITTDNNANCSSGVAALLNAVGIRVDPNMWTGNAVELLKATGEVLIIEESVFTATSHYLRRGDILHKAGHMATVIDNGDYAAALPMVTTGRSWQRMKPAILSQGLNVIERGESAAAFLPVIGGKWQITEYRGRRGWESGKWYRPLPYALVTAYMSNIREDPGLAGRVLKTVGTGTQLPLTGRKREDTRGVLWLECACDSVIGWISELMCEIVKEGEE